MTDQPGGKTIERYVIEAKIGQGGMADVYSAYDPRFKRRVAVKVLPAELLRDPTFAARFKREAETIASLEHPAIVPVYDFGEDDGRPYLVMRLMNGGSLLDRMSKGPLSIKEASELYTRLAPAIDKAHAKGIIHRDLKPSNILFDEEGCPYLSDFGIAKFTEATTTLTGGGTIGTPAYMAPEQGKGRKDLDGRADIYSLGAILFHILTGRLPYDADTPTGQIICHITEPVPDIREALPGASTALQDVIEKAMAKDRKDRYATAQVLAGTLEAVAGAKAVDEIRAVAMFEPQTANTMSRKPDTGSVIHPIPAKPTPVSRLEDAGKARFTSRTKIGLASLVGILVVAIIGLISIVGSITYQRAQLGYQTETAESRLVADLQATAVSQIAMPTPSLTTGSTISAGMDGSFFYTVLPEDSLWSIADQFGVDLDVLLAVNPWINSENFKPGLQIVVPPPGSRLPTVTPIPTDFQGIIEYTVQPGDTIGSIAVRYHSTIDAIIEANGLVNGYLLRVDMVLQVPVIMDTPTPSPTATLQPALGSTMVSPMDGMVMVYVPEGTFLMGSADTDPGATDNEKPQRIVYLDAFWMDSTLVTNALYQICVSAGSCSPPASVRSSTRDSYYGNPDYNNYPVIYVDWFSANNYCTWAGRQLPSEAQWEEAARGTQGSIYPWGNDSVAGNLLNFADLNFNGITSEWWWGDASINDGYADTSPVGEYPAGASPYGALDMSGNVWEWVADWYDDDYYSLLDNYNPAGPSTGESRSTRGGSWNNVYVSVHSSHRGSDYPSNTWDYLGFRCASPE